jgi:hypothetical protein
MSMVNCKHCHEWAHSKCVGADKKQFTCPSCHEKNDLQEETKKVKKPTVSKSLKKPVKHTYKNQNPLPAHIGKYNVLYIK